MCTHYFSDDMMWWYFKQEWKNNWDHSHFNQFEMTASTVLIQQVPFSFSRYRSLAYVLMSRYLLFKLALPFSLAQTYKRLVQPYRGFLRLCRYSKTFLRTFFTPVHTQSMPRSRDAAWIDENWTLTERRVRHLERTVLGRYLLSCHTVLNPHKRYGVSSVGSNPDLYSASGTVVMQYHIILDQVITAYKCTVYKLAAILFQPQFVD